MPKIGFSGGCGDAIVPVPRHGQAHLAARLAVRVIVVGEGELGHRLVAALPLRGALGQWVREEDPQAWRIAALRRGFFPQAVGLLGHGVGAVLAVRAIEGVELGAERAAAQGPQGIAPVAWIGQMFAGTH